MWWFAIGLTLGIIILGTFIAYGLWCFCRIPEEMLKTTKIIRKFYEDMSND